MAVHFYGLLIFKTFQVIINAQNKLIDDLIRENENATIKDFLEAKKDIENVEVAMVLIPRLTRKDCLLQKKAKTK